MTGLMHEKEFSRKSFVEGGGALILGFSLAGSALAGNASAADVPEGVAESPFASNGPYDMNAIDSWLAVHADNTVSLMSGRVELGNGSSVGLSMLAAEELNVGVDQINFVRSDTNVTPNSGTQSASSSIKTAGQMVRAAAAYAQQALLGLAAANLGVPASSLSVTGGVVSGGGKSVTYGQLLGGQLFNVEMPNATLAAGQAPAKPQSGYTLIGSYVPRFDIPAKVAGTYTYVQNIRVPGMLHARIVRPRGQGAYPSGVQIDSIDASSISHVPGARIVRQQNFLAVVAPQEYDAIQAAALLKVTWADPPTVASSGNLFEQMREFDSAGLAPARISASSGNYASALASSATQLASTYKFSYQGHLPIGPTCCVADVTPNGARIYSNSQNAYTTRQLVSAITGLPQNLVRVTFYEGSSCYGYSPYDDGATAAAVISQAVGAPVRLQFMRWDEHGWDNLGVAVMADLQGGVDSEGHIVAYSYTGFAQPSTSVFITTQQQTGTPIPAPGLGTATTTGTHYYLPNSQLISKSLPLFNNYFKLMYLRGVGDPSGVFASEQFVDELAYAAKMDPVEFRQINITAQPTADDIGPRAANVLQVAAQTVGWQPRVAASNLRSGTVVTGRGIALAPHDPTLQSVVAVVADIEVNKKTGRILPTEMWSVQDTGMVVSLDGVHNQMSGNLVMGTSRALVEEVTFNTSRVTSLDWVTYPTLRFLDAPLKVNTITVQLPDIQPYGSGEPGIVPVMAALANAFFDATGVRIRTVPMTPARVRATLKTAGVT